MSLTSRLPVLAQSWLSKDASWRPGSDVLAMGSAALLLLLSYTLVFTFTRERSFLEALGRAAQNVGPAMVVGMAVAAILRRFVLPRTAPVQAVAHLVLAPAFSLAWYLLILIVLAFRQGWWSHGFTVEPFPLIAFIWQGYQGVTVYGLIALGVYALHFRDQARSAETALAELRAATPPAAPMDRGAADEAPAKGSLLVRLEDEWRPVEMASILRVSGAGDYAEIVTEGGSFLSPKPLRWFEDELSGHGFVRVHRSHLVRLGAVLSAEPAGNGRLTLHLTGGRTVCTSRAGTAAFKAVTV